MTARALASLAAAVLAATVAVVQPVGAPPAAAVSANAVDTTARATVDAAYLARWAPATTTTATSTAVPSTCQPGAVGRATVDAAVAAWNFVRGLAGLDAVAEDPNLADSAQRAALTFSAQDDISHNPGTSWRCYTAAGLEGAQKSNIGIAWGGRTPTAADLVNGYLTERYDAGTDLGHRRWMLHPPITTTAIGVASNPATGSQYRTNTANAIRVMGVGTNSAASNPSWVPWPTAGYFPAPLEPFGLWSLTSPSAGADFSAASVSVTGPSGALATQKLTARNGYGNNTLAFRVTGVTAPVGSAESVYTVNVTGMRGTPVASYSYQVKLFNPGTPTVTAPAATTVDVGTVARLSVTVLTGRDGATTSWQRSTDDGATWTTVVGATSPTYSFTAAAGDDGALYRAVVTNSRGTVTSAAARLTVITGPVFVSQPPDATFATGGSVTLSPELIGVANASYRWERLGSAWTAIPGATGRTLTLSGLRAADSGARVRLVVTTNLGTTTSRTATLTLDDRSYVPVGPVRVHDKRSGVVGGTPTCFSVTGTGTGVPSGATGVALNVTTVRPLAAGHVVVYPDTKGDGTTPAPETATVNFVPGSDVGNAALIQVPASGRLCYLTRGASTGVVIDLTGYYLPGSGTSFVVPSRVEDRAGVVPGEVRTVQVSGRNGVPQGATAVILNVAAAGSQAPGNVRVWAAGTPAPPTSTLNYLSPGDRANAAIVPLSADGRLSYRSDTASTNHVRIVLDVVGYVVATPGYVPATPERLLDTRTSRVLGARQQVDVAMPSSAPPGTTAMVLNVAGVSPSSLGHLRVFPYRAGGTPPVMSSLNYISRVDGANLVIAGVGDGGKVSVYTDQLPGGTVHVVVDLVGYLVSPES